MRLHRVSTKIASSPRSALSSQLGFGACRSLPLCPLGYSVPMQLQAKKLTAMPPKRPATQLRQTLAATAEKFFKLPCFVPAIR